MRPPTKITAPSKVVAKENEKNLKRKAESSNNVTAKIATASKFKHQVTALGKSNINKTRVNMSKPVETTEPPLKKKKRAAWDVKGRLQDLEDYHQKTENMLTSSNDMIESLTGKLNTSQTTSIYSILKVVNELMQFKFKLENDVQEKNIMNFTMEKELEALKAELQVIYTL